jgi:hypothetical protein
MADIRAVTEAMTAEAGRLSALGPFMHAAAGAVRTTGDAAADTDAAGACEHLANAVGAAVAGFGDLEDRMANAVAQAAECYAVTDATTIPEETR